MNKKLSSAALILGVALITTGCAIPTANKVSADNDLKDSKNHLDSVLNNDYVPVEVRHEN